MWVKDRVGIEFGFAVCGVWATLFGIYRALWHLVGWGSAFAFSFGAVLLSVIGVLLFAFRWQKGDVRSGGQFVACLFTAAELSAFLSVSLFWKVGSLSQGGFMRDLAILGGLCSFLICFVSFLVGIALAGNLPEGWRTHL